MGKQLELFPKEELPVWVNDHVPFVSEVETFNKTMGKKNNYTPNKDEAHPLEHLNLFNRSSMNYLIRNTKLKLINFRSLNSLRPRYIYKDIKNLISNVTTETNSSGKAKIVEFYLNHILDRWKQLKILSNITMVYQLG